MKKHFVYFYGSTKIITGDFSLSPQAIRDRNQIIGFEGVGLNTELIEYGEKWFNGNEGRGETGTMYPKNITIVPFRYLYSDSVIIHHLEDVIQANELYIKADSIGFPLMMLKNATSEGYNLLGIDTRLYSTKKEIEIKNDWCCFGHRYLYLLKMALQNKGYKSSEVMVGEKSGNLINTTFSKLDGTSLDIHADAGL